MGESSGVQFTKLPLNTEPEPDAPEAHLGKDANPKKTLMLGKIEGGRKREQQRMR